MSAPACQLASPAAERAIAADTRPALRFLTCGSVDDGKSTLIGRLLYEQNLIFEDHLAALERDSKKHGTTGADVDFALLVDGLEAEREQGITIDVAYRYFATRQALVHRRRHARPRAIHPQHGDRRLQFRARRAAGRCAQGPAGADPPPRHHREPARHPLRRARGQQDRPRRLRPRGLRADRPKTSAPSPASSASRISSHPDLGALRRQRLVAQRAHALVPGPHLLDYLEAVDVEDNRAAKPFRMPVQWVNRPNLDFRGFAGTIASGSVKPGDEIAVLPSGQTTRVKAHHRRRRRARCREAGDAVTLTLADEIDIARGDMLAAVARAPAGRRPVRRASGLDVGRPPAARAAPI